MNNDQFQHINQQVGKYQVPSSKQKEEAWDFLQQQISAKGKVKKKTFQLNWISGAAAAAAVVGIMLWMGMFHFGKFSPAIITAIAQVDSIRLPDSSLVVLNSNSSLKYSYDVISKERLVELDGEALFEVRKGRRFIVNFDGGKVRVLGTSFLVSSYSKELSEVECVEGKVLVRFEKENIRLEKGQGVRIYRGVVTGPFEIDQEAVFERLKGNFYWNEIALKELLDVISYRYGYELVLKDSLDNRHFSGHINLGQLDDCLTVISTSMQLHYQIDELQKQLIIDAQ